MFSNMSLNFLLPVCLLAASSITLAQTPSPWDTGPLHQHTSEAFSFDEKEFIAGIESELAQAEQRLGPELQRTIEDALSQAGMLLAQAQPAPPQPPHHFQNPQPPDSMFQLFPSSGSYLGVGVEEIGSDRAKELKLREERGVEIRRVEPGS